METDFQRSASELTREMHLVLSELRAMSQTASRQLPGETPAWPLEDVTRLHQQLREAQGAAPPGALRALPEGSPTEPQPIFASAPPESPRNRILARVAMGVAVILIVVAGAFVWRLEQDVRASAARVDETQRQLQQASVTAAREIAQKQDEAARQLEAAQALAARAQTIGDVLAAPDLIRYPLVGRDALASASGQMLWSRSRGFVFSASNLPAPPQDSTYQMWLLTRGGAVNGGTFLPDAAGRVTLADSPRVPPPMLGAIVTVEPKGGSTTPSGEPLLARVPLPSPGT
jgi:hypothetical protein